MNKLLKLLIVAVVMVSSFSVAIAAGLNATIDSPIAASTVNVGQTVNLSASATGATGVVNYLWSFSDGTASRIGQNQTIAFATAGSKTINLMASDASGINSTKTVNITVAEASTALTITNIRVTDVTTSSAIVRWTTNRAADSRVIYDTVSHPSITGATSPNYGYANSTGTSDNTTKVTEHAVTVSGLAASTHYYFRVISAE
ncbi:MAG: PKD domain-containing protein [Candidatus Paceibacterota bacterium]|jgi:PKD repeat protein